MYNLDEGTKGKLALLYMLLSLQSNKERDFIKTCQVVEAFSSPEQLKSYIEKMVSDGKLGSLIKELQGRN